MVAYPIAAESIDLEIYTLSALIYGSEKLLEIEKDFRGIAWLRSTFEASEISRRIISLAVLLRSHLDNAGIQSESIVGLVFPDEEKPNQIEPLSLREACNKIIHATEVDLYNETDFSLEESGALSQQIRLYGSFQGRKWMAEVEIGRFLNAATKHS